MVFRLLGCVMIVACGALIGLEYRRRLKNRAVSFETIREYLKLVGSYISQYGMSLDDIADDIARTRKTDEFSSKIREYISQNTFYKAFLFTLKEMQSVFCFTDEDVALLGSLVLKIGGFDIDGVISCLVFADDRLNEMIASAKKKCETEGKLYLIISFCLSVVLALIII